jgi:type I restriction enzyme M protein
MVGVKCLSIDLWLKLSHVEPSWVREYFFVLYREMGNRAFTAEEAQKIFSKVGKSIDNVYKVLSPLMKSGLVKEAGKSADGKALYQIVLQRSEEVRSPSKDEVLRLLKSAADVIRTAVPYESILLLLFYKVVSDKWEAIALRYKSEGYSLEEAYILANEDYLVLYDERENKLYTWKEIVRRPEAIAEIEKALIKIAELNSDHKVGLSLEELRRLIDKVGLSILAGKDDLRPILQQLVELFNKFDFSQIDYDIIGDAYQWILSYFAPTKAKEGETYTPREVIKLMVKLMDPEDNSIIVDPACGSAAMLIESYRHIKAKIGEQEPSVKLLGQDRNGDMVAIAKMNLLLHGIKTDAKIFFGDSLLNPQFLEYIRKLGADVADYAIANPPWNQDGYSEENLSKPELRKIYSYGYPPKDKADWAWIQLLLYTAKRKAVVVIDQGTLFRVGREKEIRSKIINEDLVEAVILLPEKLFYNTNAPGVIIVFNKNKPENRKGKILFINASNEYKPNPEIRRLNILGDDNIEKIVKTYREYAEVPGFSKIVSIEEVKKNYYNLNVTLYVTPLGEEEHVDILREYDELKRIEEEKSQLLEKINEIVTELTKVLGELQ